MTNIIITNLVVVTNIINIPSTNITQIPQLDITWYGNFTFWGMIVTAFSAFIMYKANKISAQSVQEMKKQNEYINKIETFKLDEEKRQDIIQYIRKNLEPIHTIINDSDLSNVNQVHKICTMIDNFFELFSRYSFGQMISKNDLYVLKLQRCFQNYIAWMLANNRWDCITDVVQALNKIESVFTEILVSDNILQRIQSLLDTCYVKRK